MGNEVTKYRNSAISKDWKGSDGIKALPARVREKVVEAVTRFRLGEPPEDGFFAKRMDTETKMAVASELVIEHVPYVDIARLLNITRRGLQYMLARVRERNAMGLPLTWNRDRLVDTVDALEDAGYMSMSLAETDPDPRNKAAFLANAIRAYGDAGNMRIKLGVSKEIMDLLRAGLKGNGNEAPDPNDRIDYIDWVYRNKIMPKLEAAEDAELVEPTDGLETRGEERDAKDDSAAD